MSTAHPRILASLAVALAAALSGCGTPGAPQPPSLNLPARVTDLAAVRTGNRVTLTFTVPARNTDKLPLKSDVSAGICRQQETGQCAAVANLQLAPGKSATFAEQLPSELATGTPRPLRYFVELKNDNGRSAGPSNPSVVLAGQAPAPVTGLSAELRKNGVALRWTPDGTTTAVRLRRTLLNPAQTPPRQGLLAQPAEPLRQNLLVDTGLAAAAAIDTTVRTGQSYEYQAQRVVRLAANGQTLELAGEPSQPVRIDVRDIFPPAVPRDLAAVATAAADGLAPAIDLNWRPDTEADLAGYIVYRREDDAAWERISPPEPLVGPAFHDARVQPGHTYHYAVSAIDQSGHESARSAEAQETVPSR